MRTRASIAGWVIALAACGTPPTPLRDVGPVDATDRREAARSMSFLLTHFEHPLGPADDGTVIGLDLDDRVSPGDAAATDCRDRHPDRRSPLGVEGVDNQVVAEVFPWLIGMGGGELRDPNEAIRSGAHLHVIRVGELDDLVDDPDVRVELLVVERPGCDAAACPLGEVVEGEVFIDRRPPIADVRGAIRGGHLRFSLPTYLVDDEATPLHDARLDVAIGERRLSGLIAGGLDLQEINDISARVTPHPPPLESSPLWAFSDLMPSPSDPSRCQRISMAIEIDAVRVFVPY